MAKTRSHKGFWGQTIHYDKNGNKTGETWRNATGGRTHYDAHGNVTGKSYKNFWGGMTHYDTNMNPIGKSYRNWYDGTTHYDNEMNEIGRTHRSVTGWHDTECHNTSPSSQSCQTTHTNSLFLNFFELFLSVAGYALCGLFFLFLLVIVIKLMGQ